MTAEDLRSLRITHRGSKVPIHVLVRDSRMPAVFVFAPKIEEAGDHAEIHLIADCASDDPSPLIKPRPKPDASASLRSRIIQHHEYRGEGFWVMNRPPHKNGRFEDLWAAPTTMAGDVINPVFRGFSAKDRAVRYGVEFWGAGTGNHRLLLDLNGTHQNEFECLNWDICREERALKGLAPGSDGSFRLKLTLAKKEGVPPDAVNFVRSGIFVESEFTLSGSSTILTSYENEPIDLLLSSTDAARIVAWEVTDPLRPQEISLRRKGGAWILPAFRPGRDYVLFNSAKIPDPEGVIPIPAAPRALEEEGDLLVIAPESFQAALTPLLAQRRIEGWTPVLFAPREIYQAFNYGNPSPEAIQACLAHAAKHWRRHKLRAVLLVGDASPFVWQASEPDGTPTIPTHFIWIPRNASWVPSDSLYILSLFQRAGKKVVEIPWIGIGRIPARSVQQLEAAVARSLAYGKARTNRFLYLSDDNDDGLYKGIVESVKSALPSGYGSAILHLVDFNREFPLPNPAPPTQYEEPAAKAFRKSLKMRLEEGQRIVLYLGHGDLNHIAGEGLLAQAEQYNNLEEVLSNGGSPSVFITLNCLSGYFAHPTLMHSLGESMVLMRGSESGVAGMISPSSQTDPMTMLQLSMVLQQSLTGNRRKTIGEALIAAIAELQFPALSGQDIGAAGFPLLSYNLLGDPTLAAPAVLQGADHE